MKQILKSNGSLLVGDSYVKLPDENVTVLEPNECVIFRDSETTYRVCLGYDDTTDTTRIVTGFESEDAVLRFVGDGYKVLNETPDLYTGRQIVENINDWSMASAINWKTPNDSRNKPENEPLTLEELRQMDGEPVWCDWIGGWGLIHIDDKERLDFTYCDGSQNTYDEIVSCGIEPLAYRQKLERSE